jgi:hypothetical protein
MLMAAPSAKPPASTFWRAALVGFGITSLVELKEN